MVLYYVMRISNEYIHENVVHRLLSGEYAVTYEPMEHVPSQITGYVTRERGGPTYAFSGEEVTYYGLRLTISDHLACPSQCYPLRGIVWSDGVIELVWNRNPGNHFMCVSYKTIEPEPKYHGNWIQEGF